MAAKQNIKRLDDKEVVFFDQPWTQEEREKFSAMLKAQKKKQEMKKARRSANRKKKTARTSNV